MPEELTIGQVTEPGQIEDNQETEPSIDTDNQSQDQEGQTSDTAEGTTEQGKQKYYTAEEMKSLEVDNLDTSRIPPEMQPFYKSLQAVNTRKSQELSELQKRYDAKFQELSQPQKPANPLYQQYRQNPLAVQRSIDTEVRKLEYQLYNLDPLAENTQQVKSQLLGQMNQLRDMKDNLENEYNQEKLVQQGMSEVKNIENQVYGQIYKNIPNYDKRAPEIRKFAVDKLGGKEDVIDFFSSPGLMVFDPTSRQFSFVGDKVANMVGMLNKAYEIINAGQILKNKENRKPNYVESVGQGNFANKGSKEERLKTLEKKAQKEGTLEAWSEYAQAQLDLQRKE